MAVQRAHLLWSWPLARRENLWRRSSGSCGGAVFANCSRTCPSHGKFLQFGSRTRQGIVETAYSRPTVSWLQWRKWIGAAALEWEKIQVWIPLHEMCILDTQEKTDPRNTHRFLLSHGKSPEYGKEVWQLLLALTSGYDLSCPECIPWAGSIPGTGWCRTEASLWPQCTRRYRTDCILCGAHSSVLQRACSQLWQHKTSSFLHSIKRFFNQLQKSTTNIAIGVAGVAHGKSRRRLAKESGGWNRPRRTQERYMEDGPSEQTLKK